MSGPGPILSAVLVLVVSLPAAAHALSPASLGSATDPALAADAATGNAPSPSSNPSDSSPRFLPSDDATGNFGVRFKCPEKVNALGDEEAAVDDSVCPQYVFDLHGDQLGQPQLAVDPANPSYVAFHSLHGGKGLPDPVSPPPPTDRSRWNALHQPHTTFQSSNGGADWIDQRYYAFDALTNPGRTIYGEDNVMTLDDEGRAYLAALYSWREAGESDYHWTAVVYKMPRLNRAMSYFENVLPLHRDEPESLNRISDLQLIYVPEADRVVLLWLEHRDESNTDSGPASWVQAYWTQPGQGSRWEPLPQTQTVGPCQALARPVTYQGWVYFGCLPDEGYEYAPATSLEQWHIHALDARSWTTSYVAPTPIGTENARLVELGRTGHMVLIGSGIEAGAPTLLVSRGTLGANWTDPDDYADRISPSGSEEGVPITGARVTAAAYKYDTGYLHLIYMERYGQTPGVPQISDGQFRMFNKTYAVLRPLTGSFEGRFDNLGFGHPPGAVDADPHYRGIDESIFDDLHDDIVVWQDPKTDRQRLFVAFDDYGSVRYAEAEEENPGIPMFPPPINAVPIPIAAPASNAALHAAAAGVISALMLLRMLAAKKKHTVKAPSL